MADVADEPLTHSWRTAMALAHATPRCCARTRKGFSCEGPAMANGRCRMHGGASTGPRTAEGLARSKRSTWKHGRHSARYVALKRLIKRATRDLEETTKLSERMLRNAGW
ncbi:HGGxSTG domain-containing protein [Methylobacterium organophilum]|uniref:HGGxSTG domain-containing protein n=1 Tax=Methylobacterium organophilum TaxID=410 RepID=UPI0027E4432B|nr:HGGxSTG domain-containing protein [Methylobacterium organophilum]